MQLRVSESKRSFYFPPLYSSSSGSYFFFDTMFAMRWTPVHFVSTYCYRSWKDRSEHIWKSKRLKWSGPGMGLDRPLCTQSAHISLQCLHRLGVTAAAMLSRCNRIEFRWRKIITFYANFIFQFKDFPFSRNPDAKCMYVFSPFPCNCSLMLASHISV